MYDLVWESEWRICKLLNIKKNEINANGLSSKYLSYLSKKCLSKPASVLPCDHFFKLRALPNISSYIINLDNSQYSESHYVAVIVKSDYVWYFDSIGLPPGLSMNSNILNRGPRYYLDSSALDIFGKSVPMRNFKKWY